MKVKEKLMLDKDGLSRFGPVNIVIFGDSVSHGAVNEYIDYENVYWNQLKKRLNAYRDYVPVNMINASIGGTTAKVSAERLDRQVLNHSPDLVIVCFGLNDVNHPLREYLDALREIFEKCLNAGCDVIFLTPNMLNTYVAQDTPPQHLKYAEVTAQIQNSGKMDLYINSAMDLAEQLGIPVCDCYSKWKEIAKKKDTTLLLANRINHPIPEMHKLFSDSLYDMIIGTDENRKSSDSTMYTN